MDVEKAKRVLAEDKRRRFTEAIGHGPVVVDLVIYLDGESVSQKIQLHADGTWEMIDA